MFGRRRRPPALCERQQVANSSFEEIWAARPSYRPFLEDQSMLIIQRLKFCSFDCAVDDACICGLRVCLCHTSWVTSAVRWLHSVAGLAREVPADCRPLPALVAKGRLSGVELPCAASSTTPLHCTRKPKADGSQQQPASQVQNLKPVSGPLYEAKKGA